MGFDSGVHESAPPWRADGIGGLLYLGILVRFLTRLSPSISRAGPREDLGAAMTEPIVDYVGAMLGLVLIGGLIAVVGLIIWGVSQAAR